MKQSEFVFNNSSSELAKENKCYDRIAYKTGERQTRFVYISENDPIEARKIIWKHLKENHKTEYEAVYGFDPAAMLREINNVLRDNKINESVKLPEMLECKDYLTFFVDKFGLRVMDEKILKQTQFTADFFTGLTAHCSNRNNFFEHVQQFLNDGNLGRLNNSLNS